MKDKPFDFGQATFDSRDVIERVNYLETDEETLDDEEREELTVLREFSEEASGYSDWLYGTTFIREDTFVEYAQQYAEDIGAIDPDAFWPLYHIDWDAAANDLRQDYSEVALRGTAYLYR